MTFFFFSKQISKEIVFISSNFGTLCEKNPDEFGNLDINILELILSNKNLQASNEDQLFNFINNLYEKDRKYSFLYEYVIFSNVSEISLTGLVNVES